MGLYIGSLLHSRHFSRTVYGESGDPKSFSDQLHANLVQYEVSKVKPGSGVFTPPQVFQRYYRYQSLFPISRGVGPCLKVLSRDGSRSK
jgi:hypothetical protein